MQNNQHCVVSPWFGEPSVFKVFLVIFCLLYSENSIGCVKTIFTSQLCIWFHTYAFRLAWSCWKGCRAGGYNTGGQDVTQWMNRDYICIQHPLFIRLLLYSVEEDKILLFSLNYPSNGKDRVWALVFLRTMGQIGGGCHQQETLRGFQKWLKNRSSLKAFLCLWKSSESLCCLSPSFFFSALMIHVTFPFCFS